MDMVSIEQAIPMFLKTVLIAEANFFLLQNSNGNTLRIMFYAVDLEAIETSVAVLGETSPTLKTLNLHWISSIKLSLDLI